MKLSRVIIVVVVLGAAAIVIVGLLPTPLRVEAGRVETGPLRVTIDEDGESRAHDRFVVSAPVAGQLERVELHDGDEVRKGAVVARIHPLPLDPKEAAELRARLQSAEALKREAEERVAHARADLEQARRERQRAERLAKDGLVSAQSFEQAKNVEETSANELEAARSRAQAAAAGVQGAKAALMAIDAERAGERVVALRAPATGRVLRIIEKSERVVTSGMPLITIGDPARLEIVVDVLSADAVKVTPGAPVLLDSWGGDRVIQARVRTVEASAFTKVSALGVEEQRVNIVADFVDSPGALGDGYRAEARIVIWESDRVLKVPTSALFRQGGGWAVFVIEAGRARKRDIKAGHRSQLEAEVLSGVKEGDQVILHPANQLVDGARVVLR